MTEARAEGQEAEQPVADTAHGAHQDATLFPGKLIFWLPLLPLIVLDIWSKYAAFAYLQEKSAGTFDLMSREPIFTTRWVDFELVNFLNRGTVWGLGEDYHAYLKVLRFAAIGFILYFVYRTPASRKVTLLSLSLILAGAVGNLYDNLFSDIPRYEGAVRDFIHFHKAPHWDFPAFNVADSCITVGAITLFLILWRTPNPPATSATSPGKEAS